MTVSITISEKRPSGHNIVKHRETFQCPKNQRHIKDMVRYLDIDSYQCAIERGEWKAPDGWAHVYEMMLHSMEALHALTKKKVVELKKICPACLAKADVLGTHPADACPIHGAEA